MNTPLVSVDWLADHLDDPDLVILDATLAKPKASLADLPNADLQISGARFFDINGKFSDPETNLPHMMCSPDQFQKEARELGIHEDSRVVVYDQHGVYSSPRVWWMLKSMGLQEVTVLDGGLPEWVNKNYPVESKNENPANGNFESTFKDECFVDSSFVLKATENAEVSILDARSRGRFDGTEAEPREGLRSGHIPHSISLPFPEVLNGHHMKSASELMKIFEPLEIENKKLVFSCGSGLTACIILLAAYVVGYRDLTVYDGSWSEWGQPSDLPVSALPK